MIALGPIIFGLILGLIIGSQIKLNGIGVKFTLASFVVILIAGFIFAWEIGNYFVDPKDLPFSTAFLSALIGIFVGKLLFARSK
jgi:energy-converting hydrogenase B subunit J